MKSNKINLDIIDETAYDSQEGKCEALFEELKKKLDKESAGGLIDLYDEMCFLSEIAGALYYRRGIKKAAEVFLGGDI